MKTVFITNISARQLVFCTCEQNNGKGNHLCLTRAQLYFCGVVHVCLVLCGMCDDFPVNLLFPCLHNMWE